MRNYIMNVTLREMLLQDAQELAQENYDLSRSEFVQLAAKKFLRVSDAKYFGIAVRAYDEINSDLRNVA